MENNLKENMITDREKVIQYEALLHTIQMYAQVTLNHKKVSKLISNICNWSYAHRVGNGEYSDEKQAEIIKRNFDKLLDC
jgi:hypothetical protein